MSDFSIQDILTRQNFVMNCIHVFKKIIISGPMQLLNARRLYLLFYISENSPIEVKALKKEIEIPDHLLSHDLDELLLLTYIEKLAENAADRRTRSIAITESGQRIIDELTHGVI